MNYEKILTRIKKLLDLSHNAGSEEEAASAADRAQAMMAEYEIGEAELALVSGGARSKEKIIDAKLEPERPRRGKRVTWRDALAHAVARSYGCRSYWWGPDVYIYGRESAVQAVRYTTAYLQREVDSLAKAAWTQSVEAGIADAFEVRSWKNSFRVGCAAAISERLAQKVSDEKRARRAAVAAAGSKIKADAMAIVEGDEDEVEQRYQKRMSGAKAHRGGGLGSSSEGYHAGAEAGRRASLGGGRAALGRGQGQLK